MNVDTPIDQSAEEAKNARTRSKSIRTLSLSDRAEILKIADACADNKDGFGFAFYNASIVRFAIAISRMCAGHEATEKDKSDAHGPDWTERDGEYLK